MPTVITTVVALCEQKERITAEARRRQSVESVYEYVRRTLKIPCSLPIFREWWTTNKLWALGQDREPPRTSSRLEKPPATPECIAIVKTATVRAVVLASPEEVDEAPTPVAPQRKRFVWKSKETQPRVYSEEEIQAFHVRRKDAFSPEELEGLQAKLEVWLSAAALARRDGASDPRPARVEYD